MMLVGLLMRPCVSSDDWRLSDQLIDSNARGPNCSLCTRFNSGSASATQTEETAPACGSANDVVTLHTGSSRCAFARTHVLRRETRVL